MTFLLLILMLIVAGPFLVVGAIAAIALPQLAPHRTQRIRRAPTPAFRLPRIQIRLAVAW